MEAPISRRKNNHPRDFVLANQSRFPKPANQYTFNPDPSLTSIHTHENPEEED